MPKVGVDGEEGDILQFLNEIKITQGDKGVGLVTGEVEDKNVGIQMLTVFIEELEEGFAPFIQQTSELFVSMINYEGSEDIRNSIAQSLATMLKCLKKGFPNDAEMHLKYAQGYIQAIFNAMKTEHLTDTMVYQVIALKDIINTQGEFMDEGSVNQMCSEMLNFIKLSDKRKDLNEKYTEENEQGENEIDVQNRQFMEEEN